MNLKSHILINVNNILYRMRFTKRFCLEAARMLICSKNKIDFMFKFVS
jgi:hypothetical protein